MPMKSYRIKSEEGASLLYCLHITPVVESLRIEPRDLLDSGFEPPLIAPSLPPTTLLLILPPTYLLLLAEKEGARLRWGSSRYRLQCFLLILFAFFNFLFNFFHLKKVGGS